MWSSVLRVYCCLSYVCIDEKWQMTVNYILYIIHRYVIYDILWCTYPLSNSRVLFVMCVRGISVETIFHYTIVEWCDSKYDTDTLAVENNITK